MTKVITKYTKRFKIVDNTILSMKEFIIKGIVSRTKSGKDVNMLGFKPYSKDYKKTGTVDLYVSGKMLNSISSKKVNKGVKIYFPSSKESTKASANQKTREFFGLDKAQIDTIKKYIIKSITGVRNG